ncbi:MAG: Hsp20/alpha crystallin family protein [Candidatus Eisenbacteria bacterium]
MRLIRWTPMRNVVSFRDQMDSLLEDMYGRMTGPDDGHEGDWLPPMDMSEGEKDVTVSLELPGMNKEDIKVSVKDDVLTVSGEKKQEKTDDGEDSCRIERSYGFFKRSVSLPAEVDAAKVKATFKDGVLKVEMPRIEAKKPKEIPIQVS